MERLTGILGIGVLLGIAWMLSNNRRKIDWTLVIWGLALQIGLALFVFKIPFVTHQFERLRDLSKAVIDFAKVGANVVFGNWPTPLQVMDGEGNVVQVGAILALNIFPILIFFSALMAILYHYGIMQFLVRAMAWVMTRTMRISGAESLAVAANVFVGMTEAPLVIRPYIARMTLSELMTLMVGGLATIAGTVFFLYASFGADPVHLLTASLMSAPAAVLIAKIMWPETESPETSGTVRVEMKPETVNVLDAATAGTTTGLYLALNVIAMLVAFFSLIALVDACFGWVHGFAAWFPESFRAALGLVFAPLAWFMGVEIGDCAVFGQLLGTKICATEFLAYLDLGAIEREARMSERSITMATFALCGFANFMSIGVIIGGIASLAPERRKDLARLGFRAMIGGALASFMTATIAGILL